jgi:release factor glutamine methyltransferase
LPLWNGILTEEIINKFETYIKEREKHKPVDKILKQKGFYKYDFAVNEDVLSPRFDTEILVERAVDLLKDKNEAKILEFGIGSGCILLSILADLPYVEGIGVDISQNALKIALQNAKYLGVESRIKLINASWFDDDIEIKCGNKFDMIISNPPYIPSADIENLDNEVKLFDPLIALDGGVDGLRDYRKITQISFNLLKPGGLLIFEAGINQSMDIAGIGTCNNFELAEITPDLTGIDRCIILKK